ncbi:MAG: hypothetical protein R3B82_07665 [Sandaracinaceae bacterium]
MVAPLAEAQTLTVELEAVEDTALAAPAPAPVVVVRPDVADARRAFAPPPAPVYETAPAAPAPAEPEEDIEAWGGIMIDVEGMDLSGLSLDLGDPEVAALAELSLGPDWAGRAAMTEVVTGGVALHAGIRAGGFFRGPEIRLGLGGGDIEGEPVPVQVDGFALAVSSIFYLRAELALGFQLPLGPVTPYVVATGSVGVAFLDVEVQEGRLGSLGTETVAAGLFGAGLEAGVDVEIDDGTALGFAFRGSFVGTPSLGGAFRVSWGGE